MIKLIKLDYESKNNGSYVLRCNEKVLTRIPQDTLILKAKDLYNNIFADVKKNDPIQITLELDINEEAGLEIFKKGKTLHKIIDDLLKKIVDEINSL